jgi:two-component system sensor histidine kinase KdpD
MRRTDLSLERLPRSERSRKRALLAGASSSLLILLLTTAVARALGLNPTSAGLLILVGVLIVASRQPLLVASLSAIVATLLYNFFFFPPTWTFTIEDPENWIALTTFLLTSLLANRLLVRERRQADEARARRAEIETLYELSVDLLRGSGETEHAGSAAARYLDAVGAASGGVILFGASPQHQKILAWTGKPVTDEVEDIAAGVGRHGKVTDIPSRFGRDLCIPLRVGGRVRGALLIRGCTAAPQALESAANLLAFAIERERFIEDRAHVEARRESEAMKTSLLHAVSHDLKSPLTVLSVESEALERKGAGHRDAGQHVRAIRQNVARLHRRIENLLSVARFEAGFVTPRAEPTPAADLFRTARESVPTITVSRRVRASIADDTPDVLADPSLAVEIIVNLIENAHQASPPDRSIEVSARPSPEIAGRVWIEVEDRGPGLSPEQVRAVRDAGSPEMPTLGLGIEIARTLAQLNGGTVEWFARAGGGTTARIDLPAAAVAAEASS